MRVPILSLQRHGFPGQTRQALNELDNAWAELLQFLEPDVEMMSNSEPLPETAEDDQRNTMDDELKNGSETGMEQPGDGGTPDQARLLEARVSINGEEPGIPDEGSELDSEGSPGMIGEMAEPADDSAEGDLPVEDLSEDAGKEPGKTQVFLRKLLRWSAGVAGIFIIGVLAIWIVRVSPLQKELAATQAALEEVQAEAEALQDDYDEQLDINTDLEAPE